MFPYKAKPFIKWVGGKSQLLEQFEALLPMDFELWDSVTYVEPFVGGGAMLFHVLDKYRNIRHAVINDLNADLVTCYKVIKEKPEALILESGALFGWHGRGVAYIDMGEREGRDGV